MRFQAERGDVRHSAKRKKDLLRAHAHGLAVVLEGNFLAVADAAGIEEFGAGVKVNAFAAENFLQFAGGILVERAAGSWALRWITVTWTWKRAKNCANSTATGPPPSTMRDSGRPARLRAVSLVR